MKLLALWTRVRDSLWFTPGLITLGAALLAPLMINFDAQFMADSDLREIWWLFGGSPDGAREVLGTIAGSVITVAGVVFSITIVALQLASTNFTPRVLQNFMSDRSVQVVLGVFLGTFLYTLLTLRSVYSPIQDDAAPFVPAASMLLALVFALVSMGFLIYYINHVAQWIEASTIIQRVTSDTLHVVHELVPFEVDDDPQFEFPDDEPGVVLALRGDYVEFMETDNLLELAGEAGATLRVDAVVGQFVLPSTPLVSVWPRDAVTHEFADRARAAFVLRHRRTINQDVELGVLQLADIAVKALSPSINDPTTAMMAIDRIAQVLAAIGGRAPRTQVLRPENGPGAVVIQPVKFDRIADIAFSQIRRFAAGNATVLEHLLVRIRQVASSLRKPHREVLRLHIDAIEADARSSIANGVDLERVGTAVRAARGALVGGSDINARSALP